MSIPYSLVRPASRAVVQLRTAELASLGIHGVDLVDAYCAEPGCDCSQATLRLDQVLCCPSRPDPFQGASLNHLGWHVDLNRGQVVADPIGDEWAQRIGRALSDALDRRLITKMRRRRAETLQWSEPEAWRNFDVSRFEPGTMVCFYGVFPKLQPDYMLEGDQPVFAVDHYCCTRGCKCTETHVVLANNQRPYGQLNYDYRSGRVKVVEGPADTVLDLWGRLLTALPYLSERMAGRGAFMIGPFAEFLHQARGPAPRLSRRLGRNDPCYCGSGKKFKKCCQTA